VCVCVCENKFLNLMYFYWYVCVLDGNLDENLQRPLCLDAEGDRLLLGIAEIGCRAQRMYENIDVRFDWRVISKCFDLSFIDV